MNDSEKDDSQKALNPYFAAFWIAVALVGAWLTVYVGPFLLYVQVSRNDDWIAGMACMLGCAVAGVLMVWEACK